MGRTTPTRDPEQDLPDAEMLARILAFAENARGIVYGEDEELGLDAPSIAYEKEQRQRFTGMFVCASIGVLDGLFADIALLHERAGEKVDMVQTEQLSGLPPAFVGQYTALFAQELLVSAVDVTRQFVEGWVYPSTLAEELVVRLILDEVDYLAEVAPNIMEKGFRPYWEGCLYQDLDFQWLYGTSGFKDLIGGTSVNSWFEPFNNAIQRPSVYTQPDPVLGIQR